MIVVIGTKATNELVEMVLSKSRKGFDISYHHYTDTNQIDGIVKSQSGLSGILFTGVVGLAVYETLKERPSLPYGMISYDKLSFVMKILEIVLEYKTIDTNRIYIDSLDALQKFDKEFVEMLPVDFVQQVQTFEFEDITELTRENIYENIRVKYCNNEIDVAVISVAKISEELEALGIPFKSVSSVIEERVIESYNLLVEEVKRHRLNLQKLYHAKIHMKDSSVVRSIFVLLEEFDKRKEILNLLVSQGTISFEMIPETIFIGNDKSNCQVFEAIRNGTEVNFNMGIGVGRTPAESEHNASIACQYSISFGKRKCFMVNDVRDIIGPVNESHNLWVNEFEIEAIYDKSRRLGIKAFNLCRLFALYKIKTLLTTEDLMFYLNIAHRSSNRILTILVEHGILEEAYQQSPSKVGRPSKQYRLVT